MGRADDESREVGVPSGVTGPKAKMDFPERDLDFQSRAKAERDEGTSFCPPRPECRAAAI